MLRLILQESMRDLKHEGVRLVGVCVKSEEIENVEEFFLARGPNSSAEVRGLVIHDIKEVEGVRQQEEQEDKRDEENRR